MVHDPIHQNDGTNEFRTLHEFRAPRPGTEVEKDPDRSNMKCQATDQPKYGPFSPYLNPPCLVPLVRVDRTEDVVLYRCDRVTEVLCCITVHAYVAAVSIAASAESWYTSHFQNRTAVFFGLD
jgi:hypothetical protein